MRFSSLAGEGKNVFFWWGRQLWICRRAGAEGGALNLSVGEDSGKSQMETENYKEKPSEQLLSSCYSRQLLIEDCIWWNLHEIPFFLPNYTAGIMIQENPWTIYEVNFVKGKLWTTFDLFNLFDKLWIWPSLGEGNCWEGKRAQGLYLHRIISGSKENLWLFNYFSPILAFVSYHPVLDHVTCHIRSWLLFPLLSNAKNENLDCPPYSTAYKQDILWQEIFKLHRIV